MRKNARMRLEFTRPSRALAQLLRDNYGIRAEACARVRTVLAIVEAGELRYVWKPLSTRTNIDSLKAVSRLARRLLARGIPTAGPIPMNDGGILGRSEDMGAGPSACGYLQRWLTGRQVAITSRQERLGAMAIISAMHRELAATSLVKYGESLASVAGIRAATSFDWHRRTGFTQLPFFRKTPMKQAFLRSALPTLTHAFPQLADLQVALLQSADAAVTALQSIVPIADVMGGPTREQMVSWCHRDLAPHNLLWQEEVVGLIDFDQSAWDDPAGDAVQFLNHVLHADSVTKEDWWEVLDVYARLSGLSSAERWRLGELTRLPDLLIRAAAEWWRDRESPTKIARVAWAIGRERTRLRWCQTGHRGVLR